MSPDPLQWLPRSDAVNLLAGAFLLTALAAANRRHTAASIVSYAWNSRALGAIALLVAAETRAPAIGVAALLVLVIKGFLIPRLLGRVLAKNPGAAEPEPLIGGPAALLICGVLVVTGFGATRTLFGANTSILASCLPVSVAATLVGLFLMVSRRTALRMVVGLVLVENAIFLAAVSLTEGMPLVVEMGVLLDLLVGVALLGLFVGRIEETFEGGDVTRMTGLKG